jgi:lactoylglutathione lyase
MNTNVKQVVPFLMVTDIQQSIKYYVEGIGFTLTNQWIDKGKLKWCWLQLGGAAIMLQEYNPGKTPEIKTGEGVSVCFQCEDALAIYYEIIARGIITKEPFVGNNMWVVNMADPDGYKLDFESPTDVLEETTLSEWIINKPI